jgi:hypothetical protein
MRGASAKSPKARGDFRAALTGAGWRRRSRNRLLKFLRGDIAPAKKPGLLAQLLGRR